MVLVSFNQKTFAQAEIEDTAIKQIIEDLAEQLGEDYDYSALFVQLQFYKDHPLNLNKATNAELADLTLLNSLQITALEEHIAKNGRLINLLELQSVDNFDLKTIKSILPFITINSNNSLANISLSQLYQEGRNELFVRGTQILEPQRGYNIPDEDTNASRYLGSPTKIFTRYRFIYGNSISAGFTAEKDAGEQFFNGKQTKGFDYYTGHLFLRNVGRFTSIAIGDYEIRFGQGVALSSGLSFGKSVDIMTVEKPNFGIRPYTSVNEVSFFRGAATSAQFGKFFLTGFYSFRNQDGSFAADTGLTQQETLISSFSESGFHRTKNEINRKGSVGVQTFGGNLTFRQRRLSIGFTGFTAQLSNAVKPTPRPYNRFNFSGKTNTVFSVDYTYTFQNLHFFGEAAMSETNSTAFLSGLLMAVDPKLTLAFVYRNYNKGYNTLYNGGFAESSNARNEKGFFSGFKYVYSKKYEFSGFVDVYRFPYLRFLVDAPSTGHDGTAQFTYTPSRQLKMYWRLRYDQKQRNKPNNDDFSNEVINTYLRGFRYQIDYKPPGAFSFRNRVEFTRFNFENQEKQNGLVLYQDVSFNYPRFPLSFDARYLLFDTDDYNSRIYTYENDVLYAYSISVLSDQGTRYYISTRYNVSKGFDFYLRYSRTIRQNITSFGSGLDRIEGNSRSEIKAQIRLVF